MIKINDSLLKYLRKKGKLKKLNISENEIAKKMIRASGNVICNKCNKKYYDHPYIEDSLDFEGCPYLHITCNNLIVKL